MIRIAKIKEKQPRQAKLWKKTPTIGIVYFLVMFSPRKTSMYSTSDTWPQIKKDGTIPISPDLPAPWPALKDSCTLIWGTFEKLEEHSQNVYISMNNDENKSYIQYKSFTHFPHDAQSLEPPRDIENDIMSHRIILLEFKQKGRQNRTV